MPSTPVTKIAEVCLRIHDHLDNHDPANTPDRAPLKRLLSSLGSALDACGIQESVITEESAAIVAQVAVRLLTYFDGTDRHSCGRILEAEACRLLGVVASNGHVENNALPAVTKLLGQYKAWQRLCFGSLQAVCQAADTVACLASRGVGTEHNLKEVAVLLVQILFNIEDLQACGAVAAALGALASSKQGVRQEIVRSGAVARFVWLRLASVGDLQSHTSFKTAISRISHADEDTSGGKQAGIGAGPAARTRSKRPADQPEAAKPPQDQEAREGSNAQARAKRSTGRRAGGAKKAAAKKSRPASTAAGSGGHHELPLPGSSSDAALALREGNQGRRVQPPRKAKTLSKGQENVTAAAARGKAQAKKETRGRA